MITEQRRRKIAAAFQRSLKQDQRKPLSLSAILGGRARIASVC